MNRFFFKIYLNLVELFTIFTTTLIIIYLFSILITGFIFLAGGMIAIYQQKEIIPFILQLTSQSFSLEEIVINVLANFLIIFLLILLWLWNFGASFINSFHFVIIPSFDLVSIQTQGQQLLTGILDYPYTFVKQLLGVS